MKRILHLISGMDRGGIETWLMHILRHRDRERFQMDFLVYATKPCAYDDELIALGSRLFHGPHVRQMRAYTDNLREVLRQQGPYDVVHSHFHFHTGYVLKTAHACGVPVRIAHSHTDPKRPGVKAFYKWFYQAQGRRWIWRHATHGLGISQRATENLFGPQWPSDPRFRVLLYGFDFGKFQALEDGAVLKSRLGIPPERRVIGHVGRFVPLKNHAFLVRIFESLVASGMDAHLLLVGDGPLTDVIRAQIAGLGLSDRSTLAGSQPETAPYFGAMDLFLFPSEYEGLGIVVLEAQAAGVPVLASAAIPEEVGILPELIQRFDLQCGIQAWAERACAGLRRGRLTGTAPAQAVAASPFSIQRCLGDLASIYEG
jgi:glycosyltransferase involved in cell wall biosynthesis